MRKAPLSWLNTLPPADLRQLISLAQVQEIPAATVLMLEGTRPQTVYILLAGKYCLHANGRRSRPIFSPGGVIWSADRARFTCSVRTPGAVLAIDVKIARDAGILEQLRRWTVRVTGSVFELRDRSPHDLVTVAQILKRLRFVRALDLGCGGGRLAPLLTTRAAQTVLVDIDRTALNDARSLASDPACAVCARFEALPFAAASFDLVASRLALHESSSHNSALIEIRRILRRKGTLLIVDVVPPTEREAVMLFDALESALDPAYSRPPTPSQWRTLLRKYGFDIEIAATTHVRRELADRPFAENKREFCVQAIHQFSLRARAALGIRQSGRKLEWADRRIIMVAKAVR